MLSFMNLNSSYMCDGGSLQNMDIREQSCVNGSKTKWAQSPQLIAHNGFTTLLESFAELIWVKRSSNRIATFAKIYFESLCR